VRRVTENPTRRWDVSIENHWLPRLSKNSAQAGVNPQRFTGQARDGEADLDDFNARAYQPRFGRFTRPDPASGNLFQPQSWNMYSYVQDRPLVAVDPWGLQGTPAAPQQDAIRASFGEYVHVSARLGGGASSDSHQKATPEFDALAFML